MAGCLDQPPKPSTTPCWLKSKLTESFERYPKTSLVVGSAGAVFVIGLAWYSAHSRLLGHNETYCSLVSHSSLWFSMRPPFDHTKIACDVISEDEDDDLSDGSTLELDEGTSVTRSSHRAKPFAMFDEENRLVAFCDPRGPVIISSLPSKAEHIDELRKTYGYRRIDLYSVCMGFERQAGVNALLERDPDLNIACKYPTPEYASPSAIELVRAVSDLQLRSQTNLAVVHSRLGTNRSAGTPSSTSWPPL